MNKERSDFQLVIKTLPGLEEVLAKETRNLGGRDVKVIKRGVSCYGDLGFVFKANLWLRTALRVLVQLRRFQVRDEENLYRELKKLPWEEYFGLDKTFAIDATVFSKQFHNSLFIAQKSKDAVADRFREKTGRRPNVQTRQPDVRINIHLQQQWCSVSLDSSGESLHKRGYRTAVDQAPINEVLAAGILSLTNWTKEQALIDPMCGSGTFLIEAALMAHNIPANVFRKTYSFQHWLFYDEKLFDLIFEKALEKEEAKAAVILGFDKDPKVLAKAKRNVKQALMEEEISLQKANFLKWPSDFDKTTEGVIIMNPPYDEKLSADVAELYRGIGDSLKQNFSGYTAWVFSGSMDGIKQIGLRASKKFALQNGKLEAWLMRYDLYDGSRKQA